nr:MepB family protein [Niallia circulans]
MNEFYKALSFVKENFYEPNHFIIKSIQEEAQNSDYGAGIFQLNSKSVRFRVAKTTPNKVGHLLPSGKKMMLIKTKPFHVTKRLIYW